jgi:hypothetical protein
MIIILIIHYHKLNYIDEKGPSSPKGDNTENDKESGKKRYFYYIIIFYMRLYYLILYLYYYTFYSII